ncbi:MAG: PQQ-dependent sugar dehydrogenase [Gemmatimonadetes bacterium]|nr:PQQ-dependent sugar dehydrogenase [Gemmatimonadota bacterium]
MKRSALVSLVPLVFLLAAPAQAQQTGDPFPPLDGERGRIVVRFSEFARVPDADSLPARMMLLVDEPGTRRLFVNDMRGPLYSVSYDGRRVTPYLDLRAAEWNVPVEAAGRERGVQSFAFHPQFGQSGTPGYGRFYTWSDVRVTNAAPDFRPGGGNATHHTVLLEWRARNAAAAAYDGGAPREILRLEQPFANHNGGLIAFNPLARPGHPDWGLLYVGAADGGSGGDPLRLAQNLGSIFGKILRIDPLGTNSANGKYGIPAYNPFVSRAQSGALGEIYAYGMRNPQRFGWDPVNGNLFLADIGQGVVEEVSLVKPGGNLGWSVWEGSYRFVSRGVVSRENPRGDSQVAFPVVEYDHTDSLFLGNVAVTGVVVYRSGPIAALRNLVLFGDFPSGEIFAFDADQLPSGGTTFRRVLLARGRGEPMTILQVIRETNAGQGRSPAGRADLRFGTGPDGRVFLLNKADGVIRELVP